MSNNKKKLSLPPVGLLNLSKNNSKKYKKKYNNSYLYNTCYINASIQCLFRLEELIDNVLNCSGGKLLQATKNLINKMRNSNENSKLSVLEIKDAMAEYDEKYNDIYPEDANEFISDYLNGLLKETLIKDNQIVNKISINIDNKDESFYHFLNKFYKNGCSFISDLFCGILRTKNFCKKCHNIISITYHSFKILDLPLYYLAKKNINKNLDLEEIIKEFISEKEISNFICQKCKVNYYTKTDIYKLPNYLLIYFKRKVENFYIQNDIINFKTINFTNYLYEKKSDNLNYNLKGNIYYSFYSNNIGHYSASCLIGDKWYYFDDSEFYFSEELIEYEEDNLILLFYEKEK